MLLGFMNFFSQITCALIYTKSIQLAGQLDNRRRAAEHEAYIPEVQFISGFSKFGQQSFLVLRGLPV